MSPRRLSRMLLLACLLAPGAAFAQGSKWATTWTGADQGPYPIGNPSAQPNMSFVFPTPATGAHDQTFRLNVRPDAWGKQTRLRFSNAFGTQPVTFDGVFVGVQMVSSWLLPGTNRPVTFAKSLKITLAPGQTVWSDPVTLAAVPGGEAALAGRKLAVSFHVAGDSGPMTWHAKALTTSYVSPPGSGSIGQVPDGLGLTYSTASWYFLDAVDMMLPADTKVVVAFGDSITDGTASTMNGDDRWPDVLAHRLHAAYGAHYVVVNQGIGGNRDIGPAQYGPDKPFPGGPAALQRLDRDIVGLSGVADVIWLDGINDFGKAGEGATAGQVVAGVKEAVAQLRQKIKGVRVIGATLTSALGSTNPDHGSAEQDAARKSFNDFIRTGGTFDGIIDFDPVTIDKATGGMKPEFTPESTTGGPGDKLHPNRAGYLAMGRSIDLTTVTGTAATHR